MKKCTDSFDTILLGRKMTDGFVDYWENVVNNQPDSPEYSFVRKMVETPKVVFSRTLDVIAYQNRPDLVAITALCEAGQVSPIIDPQYPLSETPEALRYVGEGRHHGKVVITLESNNKT